MPGGDGTGPLGKWGWCTPLGGGRRRLGRGWRWQAEEPKVSIQDEIRAIEEEEGMLQREKELLKKRLEQA